MASKISDLFWAYFMETILVTTANNKSIKLCEKDQKSARMADHHVTILRLFDFLKLVELPVPMSLFPMSVIFMRVFIFQRIKA
jgi:hypothetical protein